ncbi:hypothetical protein, partial [Burkholderia cenocepacia]|uniref:hypothetical protein n=1 Tax=Burkholderia cenocepacia TaxID=95486 RepID=UPI001F4AE4EC
LLMDHGWIATERIGVPAVSFGSRARHPGIVLRAKQVPDPRVRADHSLRMLAISRVRVTASLQ